MTVQFSGTTSSYGLSGVAGVSRKLVKAFKNNILNSRAALAARRRLPQIIYWRGNRCGNGMPLSARKMGTAGPGRHGDGRGLFLYVKASGARSWVLRYQVMGKRHDLGLGAYPEVSLAMARDRALQARRMIQEGEDPIAKKRQSTHLVLGNRRGCHELVQRTRRNHFEHVVQLGTRHAWLIGWRVKLHAWHPP